MTLKELQDWIDRYAAAWRSNDAQSVGDLFAENAVYYTHPFRDPWRGRDEIVRNWTSEPDAPDAWEARYEALAVNGDIGVVNGWTKYREGDEYANAYVIRFAPDGRATEFTEWFMKRDTDKSASVSPAVPYTE
jgi:ketosteroid isomerase-like protein